MSGTFIVVFISILNALLGVSVLIRSPSSTLNRVYASFSLSLILWSMFNYFSDYSDTNFELLTKLTFVSAVGIVLSVVSLSSIFPNNNKVLGTKLLIAEIICGLMIIAASLTNLIVSEVTKRPGFGVELQVGPLYFAYILFILQALAVTIYNFKANLKISNTKERAQIRIFLIGILLFAFFAISSNLVLPIFIDDWSSSRFGPLFSLITIFLTSYVIIRHKLFNIRLALARSVGYVFTLAVVLLTFIFIGSFVQSILQPDFEFNIFNITLNTLLASLLLVIFPFLKKQFDILTKKFFFKDAYDPQLLLKELNQTLVADVEIESILNKTLNIIEDNIKSSFVGFYVRETAYFPSRYVSKNGKKISKEDLEKIRQITPLLSDKVYPVHADNKSNEEKILQKVLESNNIDVIARLVTTVKFKVAGVGYMLLGPKRSGEVYSDQDLKLLEIISNELVLAVENALRLEEIEQFNVTLQKKIDAATSELKDKNEKLKALDIAKDEFVSMASHQLRTPLTSIKGYISMVLEGDAGEITEAQKKMLGQAFFSSQRMVYLISDLLNISRLRTGKFIIEQREVDLADLVSSELNQLEEGAAAKNITMSFKEPKNFPHLMLDDMKLRQVVMNFIDNALYYTPQNGKITVELKEKPKSIEFTVKDSGIGVPKTEQHKLFTKFYRAENARKARPDGTGIGLFMAKKIIAASGGSIIFISKEGKGSTFGFSFPKSDLMAKTAKN